MTVTCPVHFDEFQLRFNQVSDMGVILVALATIASQIYLPPDIPTPLLISFNIDKFFFLMNSMTMKIILAEALDPSIIMSWFSLQRAIYLFSSISSEFCETE